MSQSPVEQLPGTPSDEFTPQPVNYFGFADRKTWYLPGQPANLPESVKQFLVLQRLNEGARARFQKATNADITLQRSTGDARLKVDAARDRHELIKASIVGWQIFDGDGRLFKYDDRNVARFIDVLDPAIVDELEKEIRKYNPSLSSEVSLEDIEKQREELDELEKQVRERLAGEASSVSN